MTHVATCPFCNQELCDLSKLMQHIESVHCKTISSSSDNHENIRIVGKETCFKCEKCTYFGSKKEIEKHTNSDHGMDKESHTIPEAFPCEFCSLVLVNFPSLQEHMNELHTPTVFECQYCVFASENKSTVEKHNEDEHAKRIRCQVCEEFVKDETSLKEHTDSMHKMPEPFACDLCGLVLANYELLQNHVNNDHAYSNSN